MSDPLEASTAYLAELEQTLATWWQLAQHADCVPADETAQWISFYRALIDRERTRVAALRRGQTPSV